MDFLTPLAERNLLGLLLALSISGNIAQFWLGQRQWQARLNDLSQWKMQTERLAEETKLLIAGIKQTVDTLLALVQSRGRGGRL